MSDSPKTPIVLIVGPSGVGKSFLGRAIAKDLDFLDIEIDQWPLGDGIDLEGLRKEWDSFCRMGQADALTTKIRDRVRAAGKRGAALSLPGSLVPSAEMIRGAESEAATFVVLYGTAAECLSAFLEREQATGRGLDEDHWIGNNQSSYIALSRELLGPYRLLAFVGGGRRSRGELVADIQARIVK